MANKVGRYQSGGAVTRRGQEKEAEEKAKVWIERSGMGSVPSGSSAKSLDSAPGGSSAKSFCKGGKVIRTYGR
jgi:hypothetical protein